MPFYYARGTRAAFLESSQLVDVSLPSNGWCGWVSLILAMGSSGWLLGEEISIAAFQMLV